MKAVIPLALVMLGGAFASANSVADEDRAASEGFRVLSWNISGDAFVSEQDAFFSLLRWADPDVVLLDEVSPLADPEALGEMLDRLRPGAEGNWHIDVGASGGRQRGLIAARAPPEVPPEFASIIPYPEADKARILDAMSPQDRANPGWSMDGGIPLHGAILTAGGRRLLAVIADLQCCGNDPGSWQEMRRRVEAREIRRLIGQVAEAHAVDGIVVAGDFNMVASTFPMGLLTGPYPVPHAGLIPAEIYHPDSSSTWTWDGRRTPFPSNVLDYQLYGPHGLKRLAGLVLDTERLSGALREQFALEADTAQKTGRHRPLLVEYGWN